MFFDFPIGDSKDVKIDGSRFFDKGNDFFFIKPDEIESFVTRIGRDRDRSVCWRIGDGPSRVGLVEIDTPSTRSVAGT